MSKQMITARPVEIRDAQITSSTAPFPDTGETILTATSYAVGDTGSYLMSDGVYHKVECKSAVTVNFSTAATLPEPWPDDENNSYWIDLGFANKFAPFQRERNTQNSTASPYVVAVDPGERFTAIAINNILADSVQLDVYDSSAVLIKTETRQLLARSVYSVRDWIYQSHRQVTRTLFTNLPAVSTNTFKLTFTRAAGNVQVGNIMPGVALEIGIPQLKGKLRKENFTVFTRDEFGESKITKRRNVPEIELTLIQKKNRLNGINDIVNDLNGEVTFWAAVTETTDGYFESLMIIGVYKEYGSSIDYPDYVTTNLEIEGL